MKLFRKARTVRTKFYVMVVLSAVILYTATLVTAHFIHSSSLETRYQNLCKTVIETTSGLIAGKDINSYTDDAYSFEYIQLDQKIDTLKSTIPDIYSIGIYKMTAEGMGTVFTTENTSANGDNISSYDRNWGRYRESFLKSEVIDDAQIMTDSGMAVAYCMPVESGNAETFYICASVLQEKIDAENMLFLKSNLFALAFVVIFIFLFVILFVERRVVRPVVKISTMVNKAANTNDSELINEIREGSVKTGNEIENIHRSLLKIYTLKSRMINAIEKSDDNSVDSVAWLIRRMDVFNSSHLDNSLQYIMVFLSEMRNKEAYKGKITDEGVENVLLAAPFHDVGKLMIPENIVNKPGKLTEEEFEIMKDHCVFGARIIQHMYIENSSESYLGLAKEIALHHHERWDGEGYPNRLKAEQIPLYVRVVSIATVFDTLLSKRAYNRAFSFKEAVATIVSEKGKLFDPALVDILLESKDKFYNAYLKIKEAE